MNESEFYVSTIKETLVKSKGEKPEAILSAIIYILTDGDELKYNSILAILKEDYKLN